jgi:hypothetical protein
MPTYKQVGIDENSLFPPRVETRLAELIEDKIGTKIIAGSNVTKSYNDTTGETTLSSSSGSDVVTNTRTASYTLVLSDSGKLVEMNVSGANTLTVPPNSSVAFPTGTTIGIRQYGAGTTTIVAGSGVTIRSRGSLLALAGRYTEAVLTKRATDEWVLVGDLA